MAYPSESSSLDIVVGIGPHKLRFEHISQLAALFYETVECLTVRG